MKGLRYATPRTPSRPTYGPQIAKIAAATGTPLMPWQRLVTTVGTEVLPDGSWAYTDVVVTVQRQQGKTTTDGPVAMHRCLTKRFARCWYTAQTRQDARDAMIDGYAARLRTSVLRAPLTKIRESQGSEGISVPSTGSAWRVFAPGEEALHGKPNELVQVDEHWAFTLAQGRALDAAIGPTFLTTGGQYWRHSTAGTDSSVWLWEDVAAGRAAVEAGVREGIAYFEFALPDDLHDVVLEGLEEEIDTPPWEAAVRALIDHMPASGYTLKERAVFAEARKLARREGGPGLILRGLGNRWTKAAATVLPARAWTAARRDALPAPTVPVGLAFACSRDRSQAAIVAAWREPGDPRMRWKVIDARPGTSWLAARVAQVIDERHPAAVGYDRYGPATDVGDELERDGYELERITYAEMATACIGVLSTVSDGQLVYAGHEDLDEVHTVAARKENGNRWVWDLKGSAGSIAALDAGTMAGWFFDHAPVPDGPPNILLPSV